MSQNEMTWLKVVEDYFSQYHSVRRLLKADDFALRFEW